MKIRHNLDTSVLRPLLTSPNKVKKYYEQELKYDKYISNYVRMEFLRGYIKSCIAFYFLLAMPQYDSFDEVLHIWSNKFAVREHKNIEIMISNLIKANECQNDKEKMLKYIADYIRRLIGKSFYKFKSIGNDRTYCRKGTIKFEFDPEQINKSFQDYLNKLSDNLEYKNCKINKFIKDIHKKELEQLIEQKSIKLDVKKEGFEKLIVCIEKIGEKDITCSYCSQLGDVVVALLNSIGWRIEHTDYSFDYLCSILDLEHKRHPYDGLIYKNNL